MPSEISLASRLRIFQPTKLEVCISSHSCSRFASVSCFESLKPIAFSLCSSSTAQNAPAQHGNAFAVSMAYSSS